MATKKSKTSNKSTKTTSTKSKTAAKPAVKSEIEAPKTNKVEKTNKKSSCLSGFFARKYEEKESILTIFKNPTVDVFSWQHISENTGKVCSNTNNRLHARVYKRKFIKDNHITFCKESSYANEDVGFNRACRLLTNFKFIDTPIYMWTYDTNSLTQKNNKEWGFKHQNIGLALNSIHVYDICKNCVSPEAMADECGAILGALHRGVIHAAEERPEFLQNAWDGARMFYLTIYKPNNFNVTGALYQAFSRTIREARTKQNTVWKKKIPLNMNRFLDRNQMLC